MFILMISLQLNKFMDYQILDTTPAARGLTYYLVKVNDDLSVHFKLDEYLLTEPKFRKEELTENGEIFPFFMQKKRNNFAF